jgi:hypothetical protein
MNVRKRVRSDAVLKTLPPERQQEIFDRLNQPGWTMDRARAWLAETGVSTSKRALSEFYSWYAQRRKLQQTEAEAMKFQEAIRQQMPTLSASQVAEAASIYFNLQAIRTDDPYLFLALQGTKKR